MTDITNAYIDIVKARRDYRDFNWARVDDIWSATFAEKVIQNIVRNIAFVNHFIVDGEQMQLTDEQLKNLDREKQQALFQRIHLQASQGQGHLYAKRECDNNSPQIDVGALKDTITWLGAEPTLDMISDITGKKPLTDSSCTITRFSQGQFLTTNTFTKLEEKSKIGFILDLTPDWKADWGGLLQLHAEDGEPAIAFTPKFNNLILFDASRPFSISYLAPYIKYYKYSLMGWFA
jgi:SM-20-related protein